MIRPELLLTFHLTVVQLQQDPDPWISDCCLPTDMRAKHHPLSKNISKRYLFNVQAKLGISAQLLDEGWITKIWYKMKLINSSPGNVFSSGVKPVCHKKLFFLSHKKFFRNLWLSLKANYIVMTFELSKDVTWTSPVNDEKMSNKSGSPLDVFSRSAKTLNWSFSGCVFARWPDVTRDFIQRQLESLTFYSKILKTKIHVMAPPINSQHRQQLFQSSATP